MFTGNEDQKITLAEGNEMTARFSAWLAASGSTDPTLSVCISRTAIETILGQTDNKGIRFHFALNSKNERTGVFCGVLGNEDDQINGFIGTEDKQITLQQGSEMTAQFRAWLAASGSPDPTLSVYICRKAIETILAQTDNNGIRFHFAMDDAGGRTGVFNGVSVNGNDQNNGFIGDRSYKNPPHGGSANVLNS